MPSFSTSGGDAVTLTDTTPGTGIEIDFSSLDNSFNVTVNGVNLFVGGPAGAPNELEFQTDQTAGQTVRFADGDTYGTDTPEIWELGNTNGEPVVRLRINPNGTIELSGVKEADGSLEPLELFNGMSVNSAAIAAAWNDTGSNTIVLDQIVTGPTGSGGGSVDVTCFASGTLIETARGMRRIEDLKVGDRVLCYDGGYEPIRWIGSCALSPAQLKANPKVKPIVIRADALGAGYPRQDLIVSPQHRVLVSSAIAQRMFGCTDVLIPAKKLLSLHGVEVIEANPAGVTYWHMLFEDHQIIWSNGAPTESFYTGKSALNALSSGQRSEIKELFPELCDPDFTPVPARHIPEKGRLMKHLIQRHQKNEKPVFSQASP